MKSLLKKLRQSTCLFFCLTYSLPTLVFWMYLPKGSWKIAWLPFILVAAYYAWYDIRTFEEIRREEFKERRQLLFSKSMAISSEVISAIETESIAEVIVSCCDGLLRDTGRMVFFVVDRSTGPNPIRADVYRGFDAETIRRFSFPIDKTTSVIGRAVVENEIQIIHDRASRYWCNKAFVNACRLYRFLVIPFVFRETCLGALLIENGEDLPKEHIIQSLSPLKEQIPIALENRRLYKRVEEISIRDELTGLYNYRFFMERIEEEISRCARYERKMTMVILDIDHFKRFNDEFGHQVGDRALQITARTLSENTRDLCVVARYGGEEFVIIEPEAEKEKVLIGVERLRQEVAKKEVPDEKGAPTRPLTFSAGIAAFPEDGGTADEIIRQADQALLYSKQTGRNRVTLAPAPASQTE